MSHPVVVLFNGPPAAGKTTMALECANRLKNSTFCDVDSLRNYIKNGKVSARDPNKNLQKFIEQKFWLLII